MADFGRSCSSYRQTIAITLFTSIALYPIEKLVEAGPEYIRIK
jgi:hypothetical protein